ncbi:T9SS type A sorting domain-containing protein [candidate division KSB1 bacterium]|nr:T9SS type A sorting domain-containing protein [candidate division KSB1 bacterium]
MAKTRWYFLLIIVVLLSQGNLFAQQRCMFVSAAEDPGDARDLPLIEKLISWGYDVTIVASTSLAGMLPVEFSDYDFAFLSESPNSSDMAALKGHPLPIVNLEAWAVAKPAVLNWAATQTVSNVGPSYILIVADSEHQLAAGFPTGADMLLATDSSVEGEAQIAYKVTIDVITVATFVDDPEQLSVCAAEEGTLLADEETITENRAVTIGIHANAYEYITDEAYQLMQAAIHWVLHEGVGVEMFTDHTPLHYSLDQNFPNPFNPSTEITFSLQQPEYTKLTVFDALGREVETLVDGKLGAGSYKSTFDARNLPGGVYFYQLQAGNFSEMKKMVLVK